MQKTLSKRHLQIVKLAGDLVDSETKPIGYMARILVTVNLPYRDPGKDARFWLKKNGLIALIVTPAYNGEGKNLGLPYGSYPRLILSYLITQAVKTQSSTIFIGKSFREFLSMIDVDKGGKQYRQLQKQLERTLSASFSWTYENEKVWSRTNVQLSHESKLWWNPKYPEQQTLWESYIKLNTDFFNEIIRHPVPLDLRVLKVFKNSPLGLDLCMFLSWRVFNLKRPVYISWETLHAQLGGQYANLHEFSRDCRKHLIRIQAIWSELNIKFLKGRLYIAPTLRVLVPVQKT